MRQPNLPALVWALVLPTLATATTPPDYNVVGLSLVWSDSFDGNSGSSPNTGKWNIITGWLGVNGEAETYTASNQNLQLSGGQTLQIVPRRSSAGAWTSGRIESKATFTPGAGKVMVIEAKARLGTNPATNKAGIWPAVWLLGDSYRSQGIKWPACGEIDLMENINGQSIGYGVVHCGSSGQGGPCNEPSGLAATKSFTTADWHTWRVWIDRRSNNWQTEAITIYLDGVQFNQITGSQVGDQNVWATLAHSPLYMILNVAVGGAFPGPPNANTIDGYGSMLEVAYAAVYTS